MRDARDTDTAVVVATAMFVISEDVIVVSAAAVAVAVCPGQAPP